MKRLHEADIEPVIEEEEPLDLLPELWVVISQLLVVPQDYAFFSQTCRAMRALLFAPVRLNFMHERYFASYIDIIYRGKWEGLAHVVYQTPELCLAAVAAYPYALQHVREQWPELCRAAVAAMPHVLAYVHDQTDELCLTALRRSGWVLQYIRQQTMEHCLTAVRHHGAALQHVQLPQIV